MFHTVPLQSLLDWLFKPKGPTLVEVSQITAPYKALAIAVTKRTLYEENPPLVGVGLLYRPHYILTVPFSAAYMHLNVWHSAASNEESENRLDEPHLLSEAQGAKVCPCLASVFHDCWRSQVQLISDSLKSPEGCGGGNKGTSI